MTDLAAYAGLFLAALLAATILPMQSEAVLVGLLLGDYSPWLLIGAALQSLPQRSAPASARHRLPVRRMISTVPIPSARNSTISARQTCFCGLLRSLTSQAPMIRRRDGERYSSAHAPDSHAHR
ncbi:hypothetical protein X772_28270 [Mesorhizobium sp. LSJC280B00]|nr:hypothetical protein X772_28270 [Mesorhizobium sp. LSJC280B00]